MKSYEHENMRYEIVSELGDDFLFFDAWARQTLTEAEYDAQRADTDHLSEAHVALFQRWKDEQKITSFLVYKDGVLENG
jgi:hypothetical protein